MEVEDYLRVFFVDTGAIVNIRSKLPSVLAPKGNKKGAELDACHVQETKNLIKEAFGDEEESKIQFVYRPFTDLLYPHGYIIVRDHEVDPFITLKNNITQQYTIKLWDDCSINVNEEKIVDKEGATFFLSLFEEWTLLKRLQNPASPIISTKQIVTVTERELELEATFKLRTAQFGPLLELFAEAGWKFKHFGYCGTLRFIGQGPKHYYEAASRTRNISIKLKNISVTLHRLSSSKFLAEFAPEPEIIFVESVQRFTAEELQESSKSTENEPKFSTSSEQHNLTVSNKSSLNFETANIAENSQLKEIISSEQLGQLESNRGKSLGRKQKSQIVKNFVNYNSRNHQFNPGLRQIVPAPILASSLEDSEKNLLTSNEINSIINPRFNIPTVLSGSNSESCQIIPNANQTPSFLQHSIPMQNSPGFVLANVPLSMPTLSGFETPSSLQNIVICQNLIPPTISNNYPNQVRKNILIAPKIATPGNVEQTSVCKQPTEVTNSTITVDATTYGKNKEKIAKKPLNSSTNKIKDVSSDGKKKYKIDILESAKFRKPQTPNLLSLSAVGESTNICEKVKDNENREEIISPNINSEDLSSSILSKTTSKTDAVEDNKNEAESAYNSTLSTLRTNYKPLISKLTRMAECQIKIAPKIVQSIEKYLSTVESHIKLIVLYLIDSILKNVKKVYVELFSQNIVSCFFEVFAKGDEEIKKKMFKLRQSWNVVFSEIILHEIDTICNSIDKGWPITSKSCNSQTTTVDSSISTIPENLIPVSNELESAEMDDALREKLLVKEKELLDMQQKKIMMELAEIRNRAGRLTDVESDAPNNDNIPTSSPNLNSSMPNPIDTITNKQEIDNVTTSRQRKQSADDSNTLSKLPKIVEPEPSSSKSLKPTKSAEDPNPNSHFHMPARRNYIIQKFSSGMNIIEGSQFNIRFANGSKTLQIEHHYIRADPCFGKKLIEILDEGYTKSKERWTKPRINQYTQTDQDTKTTNSVEIQTEDQLLYPETTVKPENLDLSLDGSKAQSQEQAQHFKTTNSVEVQTDKVLSQISKINKQTMTEQISGILAESIQLVNNESQKLNFQTSLKETGQISTHIEQNGSKSFQNFSKNIDVASSKIIENEVMFLSSTENSKIQFEPKASSSSLSSASFDSNSQKPSKKVYSLAELRKLQQKQFIQKKSEQTQQTQETNTEQGVDKNLEQSDKSDLNKTGPNVEKQEKIIEQETSNAPIPEITPPKNLEDNLEIFTNKDTQDLENEILNLRDSEIGRIQKIEENLEIIDASKKKLENPNDMHTHNTNDEFKEKKRPDAQNSETNKKSDFSKEIKELSASPSYSTRLRAKRGQSESSTQDTPPKKQTRRQTRKK